ncbi:Cytochrome P450 [Naviculisporaceae sp. PSN 640]
MASIVDLLLVGAGCLFLTYLLNGIYNAFFHRLAKVPGPKLWVFSDIFYIYYMYCGTWPLKIQELHEKYGPVVRFTANDISFISPGAWKAIYNYQRTGPKKNFQKDMRVYRPSVSGHTHIVIASDEEHRRHRRLLGYAFAEKALRGQEPAIQHYISQLIKQLNQCVSDHGKADLNELFSFTTFDVIGDLSFGNSLGDLERGEYQAWVSVFFESIKLLAFDQVIRRYPIVGAIVMWFIPRRLKQARQEHWGLANRMVRKRLASGDESREDFMSYILAHNNIDDKTKLTDEELVENAYVLVAAGSETTATTLCGIMYYLLTNRDMFNIVLQEILNTFTSESEITAETAAKLPYLNACIEESLRLYPALPTALPRIVPEHGRDIEGYFIPEGTGVGIPIWAASRSEASFRNPLKFVPERWMGNAAYANDKLEAAQAFSMGPRNCIGKNLAYLEIRLVLTRLLWNFDFDIMPESLGWLEDPRIYIFHQKSPLFVKIAKRCVAETKGEKEGTTFD